MKQLIFLLSLVLFMGCSENVLYEDDSSENDDLPGDNIVLVDEPYLYQQWSIHKDEQFYNQNAIHEDAHIHTDDLLSRYSGKGIRVAVIDDGLDIGHEDLRGAVVASYDISSRTADVSHSSIYDFHGTAVTGIIAARKNNKGILGLASRVEIIFLKYKDDMSDSQTIELFNKAEEFGADIINCSWGTYDVSDAVRQKIVNLSNNGRDAKGTIIVFASGNDGVDMQNDESAIPEVISVGASDEENLRAYYSNYGKNLDIVAPGSWDTGIATLDPMGYRGSASKDDDYILYNDFESFVGTSASAPIVSGVIALMLEKNPNLSRVEVENILKRTADKIGNPAYKDARNNYYGYGKINLSRIMNY